MENTNNRIKYDYDKLANILANSYRERTGKPANKTTMAELINCLNDTFMDEWRRQILEEDRRLQAEAKEVFENANKVIEQLSSEVKTAKESGIQDSRVLDALKAYKMIIDLDFDTPQQRLQNIQNASYFVWALFSKDRSEASKIFFKDARNVTSVKDEPDQPITNRKGHNHMIG